MLGRAYTIQTKQTFSTAITALEVTAGAGQAFEILRAWVSNTSVTTSAQCDVALLRKTATITGTALSPAAVELGAGGDTSFAGSAKHTATAEGTDGDILFADGMNSLNGWFYLPTPEERETVPAGGLIAIKFITAPTSASYRVGIRVRELG